MHLKNRFSNCSSLYAIKHPDVVCPGLGLPCIICQRSDKLPTTCLLSKKMLFDGQKHGPLLIYVLKTQKLIALKIFEGFMV